ncbi:L10-interacting MYB domain-containing protein [Camellia lanceoleosa]|uniref:L10-interacting MYB domain-containing protein n=1 Tax=Camellia lanceoleosa TaxID=1840588 RepID=A0ACC0F4H5_9ERIC|nr:L10-interacting MYB domain-containing protein [Camellia lanceoleosa]
MDQSRTLSTPSKNLCKRGTSHHQPQRQTQPDPQSSFIHKAVWGSDVVWLFLELVVKELEVGYKGSFHTMAMHGYRVVSKAFQECTNRFHKVKQLQNNHKLLKMDWQSWSRLMDTRHGPTGISYHEQTGLIQASNEWWAKYEKHTPCTAISLYSFCLMSSFSSCCLIFCFFGFEIDKNSLKLKSKPLEHVELMRTVYEGVAATRKYAWTPGVNFDSIGMDDVSEPMDEEDYEDSSGLSPFQPAQHSEHTMDDFYTHVEQTPAIVHAASSAIHIDDTSTSGATKRKFPATNNK